MSSSAVLVPGLAGQSDVRDYDDIVEVMNRYNEGVRTGRSATMKSAFHEAATVFGYIDGKLLAGSIQMLFDWVDGNGPSQDLQSRIASVSVHQTIAVVRVELENLRGKLVGDHGARLCDLFQFLKIDGTWKISQKSFHWYS